MTPHPEPGGILEDSYRAIFDTTSDAICVYDLDTGEILDTNRSNCELHGLSIEEIRARGVRGMSPPRPEYGEERAAEYVARAVAGEVVRYEWATVTRRGEEIFWDTQLTRATLHGRAVLITVARDIREQKRTEERLRLNNLRMEERVAERGEALAEATSVLRAREEHFARIMDNLHDMISIVDADGHYTYVSPSVHAVLGYEPKELLGKSGLDLVHPDDLPEGLERLGETLAQPGKHVRFQHRFRHRDGSWRWVEDHGVTFAPGSGAEGILVNTRDITWRKEAEEALRRSEERFRAMIENAHDGIAIVDRGGALRYQSPSLERLTGLTPSDAEGRSMLDLVHPKEVSRVAETLAGIAECPGSTGAVEFRLRGGDGAWRTLEAFGRTLSPATAEEGIVVNLRDVTERREAEQALRRATAEAERANLAKSEFLSRMSHELRTPLNSILGFGQILERVEMDPRDRRAVRHILTAGEHLLNLVNEVLDIARIEAGRQPLSIEPAHLATVLAEAVALVRPLGGTYGVRVVDAAAPSDVFVQADRQRLVQVLLNLLSNGVKYNTAGGSVAVSWEPSPAEGRTRIRVDDTGPGIPAERRGELFTPFARLGAEQGGVEGTGLGLALARRLAEAMGGTLWLEASSAAGSTFCIDLRTASAPAVEAGPRPGTAAADQPPSAPASILYVEDNLANLSLVEQLLAYRPAWRLIPALQGQLGIELAREHRPDLILLDLHLPDIGGEEVFQQLRAEPRTAGIPVIVVSADATPGSVARLRAMGVDGYLAKPLRIDEFLGAADAALAPGRPA